MNELKRIFESIEDLLKNVKFSDALNTIKQVDTAKLTSDQYPYYCLLLSQAMLSTGDNDIEDYIEKALSFFKTGRDDILFARSKCIYGWYLAITGSLDAARQHLLESYVLFKRHDKFQEMSMALNWMAFVNNHSGAVDNAVTNLRECIELNRKLGNKSNEIVFSRNLATVYIRSGSFKAALKQLDKIENEVLHCDKNFICHFYLSTAIANALSFNIDSALNTISYVNQRFLGSRSIDRVHALYHEYLGWIYNLNGEYADAAKILKKGIALSLKIAAESALISQTKRLLADAYVGLKEFDLAEKTAREALAVAEKIRERSEIGACYRVFAQVELNRGNGKKAKKRYHDAIDIFLNVNSRYELAMTRYLAAMSGLYQSGERAAMLYLAKEYFQSEDITHYVRLADRELNYSQAAPIIPSGVGDDAAVFIARDRQMVQLIKLAENVASSSMTIFLTGPTGSGKDRLARYIHERSGRKGKFVIVNSAAIPDSMVEAELFGFRKGSFTGAEHHRTGLLEEADGGTFYLNEIADATPEFQAKLLEVIETKFIRPLGSNVRKAIDIRIIAATNNDLDNKMKSGRFRRDLYHRLNEIPIILPSLKERPDDFLPLIEHFLAQNGYKFKSASDKKYLKNISSAMIERPWPGHVRELKAEINRLYLLADGDLGKMAQLVRAGSHDECDQLINALEQSGWNRREAARILGISEGAVRYRIKKYQITQDTNA